ncbi:MAG: glycosyltransferase 61 family protein, partial [Methylococcaceae bacterium]
LSANKIAYGFQSGEIPFWIISGDRQFAYPLAWLLCPAQKCLIQLSDGSTGTTPGLSTFEHWLGRIEVAMKERGNIPKENKTGYPVITLGHQNFAHHLWNELPALEEWLSRTTAEQRQHTRLIPVQEPLGLLEQIFPELEPTRILRTERSLLAINQIPGCLVPVGSRKISQRVRDRVGAHLAREAGLNAQNIEQNFIRQHKPIVWISVRDHDRTCINQEEFLAAVATSILHAYPDSGILFDGFAFAPGESEGDIIIANEQRAIQTTKTIAAIKARIRVADSETRVHSLSGIPLLDNLYLGRFVDYYICHAGTLQHKLGWLYDVPGIIHTLNGKDQDYRPVAAWYAGQVENGRKPQVLPGEYILSFLEDKTEVAARNRNYVITRIYEAVQHILQDMNTSLSQLKSNTMTDRPNPDLPYEYRLIHTTQVIPLAAPVRLDKRAPIHPRLALKKARLPDTGVAIIPNGKACLELPCQYYDAYGNEINEVFDPVAIHPDRSLPEHAWVKLRGRVCPLVIAGGGIYAHWLGDILPAVHLLQLAGITLDSIDHWIVNRTDLAYHGESLDVLGIDRSKVIPWSRDLRFIQADELIVPSRARTHLYTGQWIIEWLRKTFVPAWPLLSKRPGATRLYLSREKASKRLVTNEAEVIEILMAYGFQVLYLEKMPLTEAARLLAQAEVVIAPHGAGLANMVFCTPGTRLLELYSWHISQEYWMTAATLGLNYANLACPGPDGQYYDEIELDYSRRFPEINSANITVDCQTLKHFLEEYVPAPAPRVKSPSLLPPVFIFAACWRTGSTLVQRLLNTSEQLMIWGEPGYLDLMRRVYEMMTRQTASQEKIWESLLSTGLSDQWVPNLAPKRECTQEALNVFFNHLYYSSAAELKPSCRAWGMKEVRAGAMDNTLFIHQIIPDARFIFLFRDPVDCFESVIASNFYRHFEDPLFPMKVYADNMRRILALRDAPPAYDYHILRYEDLIGDEWKTTLDSLFEFVGVPHPEMTESVIQGKKLGGSINKMPLPDDVRLQLADLMGSLPGQLGYEIR